ncbi:hypothetical protein [Paenibacillus sp. Marseille-Q4541]|uniref:hypothetical protein n=1 Tax=Paenibacillus sp. Marseille-Q4541 TaxID=2831522 RepID=UPI001BA5C550|nr:hypothetical protein [Paenibacillus sp. Marseille-Q4541]
MNHYDSYVIYPQEAFTYLIVGLCLTMIAYVIIQLGRKQVTQIIMSNGVGEGRDNRVFINKIWAQGEKIANKVFLFLLAILVIIAIFDLGMALRLLNPIIFLGMTGYWFLDIVHDEGEDKAKIDLEPQNNKLRYFLRLIDSRRHPFSLPLVLFIIIVLTFLLSKYFGFSLSLETSGNPYYVMSLPAGTFITAGLVFACSFIYIFQHGDFFGIRQANQSDYKVMRIHFGELIICGATFFIWLLILIVALFTSY